MINYKSMLTNCRISLSHFLFILFLSAFVLILSGCPEDSVDQEACTPTANSWQFCLKIIDSENNILRNLQTKSTYSVISSLNVVGTNELSNFLVTFSSENGTLDPASGTALTDSNGKASVNFITGTEIFASVIKASISINDSQYTVDYNFAIGGSVETDPTLVSSNDTSNSNDTTSATNNDVVDTTDASEPSDTTDTTDTNNAVTAISGAIEFVSSEPDSITLRGTGGTKLTEFSTITFRLIGSDGLPLANRTVNFSLDINVGGIDIFPLSAETTSEGIVYTTLQAGYIPTSVRVNADAKLLDLNGEIQNVHTQSDQLVISTGIPDQNSFTLSVSEQNPEAWDYNGVSVIVTAYLADHFNNHVPDGTTVYFTTEGGVIESSCQTENSECTVVWKSQNPRPTDHRVTILATTIGNESFVDINGDGQYTIVDGEPYIDINNNSVYDEPFVDDNNNSIFDEPFVSLPNGVWDVGEDFTDQKNQKYDFGESFTDKGNGVWDKNEPFADNNPTNGIRDVTESFTDLGDGRWNLGEPFVDALNGRYDVGEPFVDVANNLYEYGDLFIDHNGNGKHDGNLALASGEISFTDSNNGNNKYDGAGTIPKGENYYDIISNSVFDGPGFADLAEPFLDSNENFIRDPGEFFLDANKNGIWDKEGDGLYNGILCINNKGCSNKKTIFIKKSVKLIMSGSQAKITVKNAFKNIIYASNDEEVIASLIDRSLPTENEITIYNGESETITVIITDLADQIMPNGTTIDIKSTVGTLSGETSYTVRDSLGITNPNKTEEGKFSMTSTIYSSNLTFSKSGILRVIVSTPTKIETLLTANVRI